MPGRLIRHGIGVTAFLVAFSLVGIHIGCGSGAQKGFSGEKVGGWQRTLGGETCVYARDIVALPSGGFAIVGDGGQRDGEATDVVLIVVDEQGDPVWERRYGGEGWDRAYGILSVPEGGFFLVGDTNSQGAGLCDAYVIRADAEGDLMWERTVGGPRDDWVYSAQLTSEMGLVMVGQTESFYGVPTVFLARLDAEGNVLWARGLELGGMALANEIRPAGDGFVLAGWVMDGKGDMNALAVYVDQDGEPLWTKEIGDPGEDWFASVTVLADGGLLFVGATTSTGSGMHDVLLVKTDERGNVVFRKTWGETGEDYAHGTCSLPGGKAAVVGSTSAGRGLVEAALLVILDDQGEVVLEETHESVGASWLYAVTSTEDGGLVATGRCDPPSEDGPDVLLVRREGGDP